MDAHSLTFGFQFARTRNGSSFFNDTDGTIFFYGVEDIATDGNFGENMDSALYGGPTIGSIYEATASIDPSTDAAPNVYRGYRANEFSAFAQDDWKLTRRLTITAGLRWDYFGPPHNAEAEDTTSAIRLLLALFGTRNIGMAIPSSPPLSRRRIVQGAQFIQKNSDIWNKDTNNLSSSRAFGFSYDLTGKGTLVMRGGFGIGYDRLYNNAYENLRFNPPRFADNSVGYLVSGIPVGPTYIPGLYTVPFTANSILGAFGAKPVPRHIDQRLVTAYYEQANFGFEYQLAKGYVLETNYVGTFGRKLVGLLNINTYPGRNACPVGSGDNDDGTYSAATACGAAGFTAGFSSGYVSTLFNSDNFRTNAFNSNYNAFQVSVRKSYAKGLRLASV